MVYSRNVGKLKTFLIPADMAELADAHGSGPCEGSFMKVRILLSAPRIKSIAQSGDAFYFSSKLERIRTWEGASVKPEAPVELPAASGPQPAKRPARKKHVSEARHAVESFYPHQRREHLFFERRSYLFADVKEALNLRRSELLSARDPQTTLRL